MRLGYVRFWVGTALYPNVFSSDMVRFCDMLDGNNIHFFAATFLSSTHNVTPF